MSREALKQALEALYENTHYSMQGNPMTHQDERNDDTIRVIKEALAQPEEQLCCDRPEQMARLGWQCFECPACGSEGARAFPKPEQSTIKQSLTVEQEPVAKVVSSGEYGFPVLQWISANHSLDTEIGSLLYTSPPQRQPLTDAEIWQMVNDCSFNRDLHADKFARAIEAAHGIGDKT